MPSLQELLQVKQGDRETTVGKESCREAGKITMKKKKKKKRRKKEEKKQTKTLVASLHAEKLLANSKRVDLNT